MLAKVSEKGEPHSSSSGSLHQVFSELIEPQCYVDWLWLRRIVMQYALSRQVLMASSPLCLSRVSEGKLVGLPFTWEGPSAEHLHHRWILQTLNENSNEISSFLPSFLERKGSCGTEIFSSFVWHLLGFLWVSCFPFYISQSQGHCLNWANDHCKTWSECYSNSWSGWISLLLWFSSRWQESVMKSRRLVLICAASLN